MKQIGNKVRLIVAVISILTVLSVITVLAAEVVIDAFSDQSQNVSYTIPASPTFPHQICDYATTTSGTLGGHRDVCLTLTGGNQDSIGRLQVSTANQYLLMARKVCSMKSGDVKTAESLILKKTNAGISLIPPILPEVPQ